MSPPADFLPARRGAYGDAHAARVGDALAAEGYETDVKVVVSSDKMSDIVKCNIVLYLSVLEAEEENTHIARVREVAAERLNADPERVAVEVNYVKEGTGGSQ